MLHPVASLIALSFCRIIFRLEDALQWAYRKAFRRTEWGYTEAAASGAKAVALLKAFRTLALAVFLLPSSLLAQSITLPDSLVGESLRFVNAPTDVTGTALT
jgi:hypothetical protein